MDREAKFIMKTLGVIFVAILVTVIYAIVLIAGADDSNSISTEFTEEDYKRYHDENLCFDADSLFLVINKSNGMYEITDGTTLLAHGCIDTDLIQGYEDYYVTDVPTIFVNRGMYGGYHNNDDKANWWRENYDY